MDKVDKDDKVSAIKDLDILIHSPARLSIMANLYVLESADFTFLLNQTELTWGNLSTHIRKLDESGYVGVEKTFVDRKPKTMLALTEKGRQAFKDYRDQMQAIINDLPD